MNPVLMKLSILIFAFILLSSCQTISKKQNNYYFDLNAKIDAILIKNKFNGVVSLTKDASSIYVKHIGYSDIDRKVPIAISDQFVIGSISKQITAVLVLREYEKNNIALNDKLNQYLIDINQPWSNEVTIHQLLSHTHGIVDFDKPLNFKAGSQFNYSQIGYELLAKILEKVTGKTFEILSTEFFFEYELQNTFHPENRHYKHLVKGYEENEHGVLEFSPHSLYNYAAAGSFISNVKDLNRWNELLHSERLLKKETFALMKTRYATRIHPIFGTVEYGYGLLFKEREQGIQIGALGYAPGFASAGYFYPQTNLNLVILTNTTTDLNDFKKIFKVHTEIMKLVRRESLTQQMTH